MLNQLQPEVDDMSQLCANINENICNDGGEAEELRQRLASLENGCKDQREILQMLYKQ